MPITVVKLKTALPVKETQQMMKRDVKILRYGRNQIVAVEFANVNSMVSSVFLAHFIETVEENKDMKKTRERLEQRLHERLTPILELKSTCRDFQRCPRCMVTYKVNQDFPHKCLHAQCKHCLEFVSIYQHKCYITSEEEQKFKRALQKLRSKKKKIETILGTIV